MRSVEIQLLGRFEVKVDGRPLPAAAWRQWSPRVSFVTDGAERALELAREAERDRVVAISGASPAQQLLRLRKVDEIQVSVTPLLLGAGVRLFEGFEGPIRLEQTRVVHPTASRTCAIASSTTEDARDCARAFPSRLIAGRVAVQVWALPSLTCGCSCQTMQFALVREF
jgi:RibD C-terminal domain